MNSETYNLLLLSTIPGIGHSRLRVLLRKFGSAQSVLSASFHQLIATDGFDQKTVEKILDPKLRDAKFVDDQLFWMKQHQARLMTIRDADFPVLLKAIYDPPAYLFVRGEIKPEDHKAIAVVGTRMATSYGRLMTEKISRELCEHGITVVSGLARGVDTMAHESAIRAGGRTIAVLGSGVDRIYPPENFKLAMEIIDRGAVISDYPMKTGPDAVNFPGRNRIISGLSLGSLVVEAAEKSGSLITAEFALEQNREVFAIPGPANSIQSRGTNRLIKSGAKLVESVDDILSEVPSLRTDNKPKITPNVQLNLHEQMIFDKITHQPLHVDEISTVCHMSTHETLSHLLNLELVGAIRQLSGKMFVKQ